VVDRAAAQAPSQDPGGLLVCDRGGRRACIRPRVHRHQWARDPDQLPARCLPSGGTSAWTGYNLDGSHHVQHFGVGASGMVSHGCPSAASRCTTADGQLWVTVPVSGTHALCWIFTQTEHKREGADLDDLLGSLRADVNPEGVPGVPHLEGWVPPTAAQWSRMLDDRARAPVPRLKGPSCGACDSCLQPWLKQVRGPRTGRGQRV